MKEKPKPADIMNISDASRELSRPPVSYAALASIIEPEKFDKAPELFLRNGHTLLLDATRHGVPELARAAFTTFLIDKPFLANIHSLATETGDPSRISLAKQHFGADRVGDIFNTRGSAELSDDGDLSPLEQTYNNDSLAMLRAKYQPGDDDVDFGKIGLQAMMKTDDPATRRIASNMFSKFSKSRKPYPYDLAAMTEADLESKRLAVAQVILDQSVNLITPRHDGLREGDAAFLMRTGPQSAINADDPNAALGLPARTEIVLRTMLAHQDAKYDPPFRPLTPDIEIPFGFTAESERIGAAQLFNRVGREVTKRLADPKDALGQMVSINMPESERTFWHTGAYKIKPENVIYRTPDDLDDLDDHADADDAPIDLGKANELLARLNKKMGGFGKTDGNDDSGRPGPGTLPPPTPGK